MLRLAAHTVNQLRQC